MAENKKSFVLYADLLATACKMPKEKAGELFITILEYVNDLDPEPEDLLVQIAFEPIKQQLKRDLKEWESKKMQRAETGRVGGVRSGEARRSKRSEGSKNEANEATLHFLKQNEVTLQNAKQNEANEAVTVNVTVTDTVINPPISPTGGLADDEPEMKVGFVVPDMCRLWYKKFPHYTQDLKKDQHAMGQIIAFIEKNEAGREGGVREIVEKIADEVEKDRFWVNKALSSIAYKVQEFYNKIKNPHAERTNPKTDRNGGFGILAEELKKDMAFLAARKQGGVGG